MYDYCDCKVEKYQKKKIPGKQALMLIMLIFIEVKEI